MANYEQMVESLKPGYRLIYEYKTLDELRAIHMDAVQIIASTPTPTSPAGTSELLKQIAIKDVCAEYIDKIQKSKRESKKAIEEFKEAIKHIRKECILNLKAAASANGQLVAAILEEEDGLTAEQIGTWCEELETLDDTALKKLLDDLCREGIIVREEDNTYHLLYILDESMKAEPASLWAMNKLEYGKLKEEIRYLLDIFRLSDGGYTYDAIAAGEVDIREKIISDIGGDAFTGQEWSKYAKDLISGNDSLRANAHMRRLELDDLIDIYNATNGLKVFYYPLLGNKEA